MEGIFTKVPYSFIKNFVPERNSWEFRAKSHHRGSPWFETLRKEEHFLKVRSLESTRLYKISNGSQQKKK